MDEQTSPVVTGRPVWSDWKRSKDARGGIRWFSDSGWYIERATERTAFSTGQLAWLVRDGRGMLISVHAYMDDAKRGINAE